MIARAQREGLDLSADYLQRYREGTGGTDYWSWDRLTTYEAAREADARIHDYFEEWFTGERDDKTVGAPFLDLGDGESITMGALGKDSSVRWTADWGLPALSMGMSTLDPSPDSEEMQKRLDFGYALGEAAIRSYGRITFTRRGEAIHVEGIVDFRFDEPYDYEPGFLAYLASRTTADAPTIGNDAMRRLAETGPARVFRTFARQLRLMEGVIALDGGEPDVERSWFVWKDITPTGDPL